MYRFPEPGEGHTLQRRDLLDWYGFIAHVSIPISLVTTYCCITIPRLRQKRLVRKNVQITTANSKSLSTWRRKFIWWCNGPSVIAGYHLGTRGVLIGAVIWTSWLLVLTFLETDEASQLPFHYMLSLKTSYSPIQLITQHCSGSLIQIHKQLGYIVTLFFCVHTVLYVNFFVQTKLLLSKLTQQYIICGSFGIAAFAVIGVTALKPIRDRSYRIFYILHVVLSIALIPVLYFHGSHMRIYLWEILAIYILNQLLRLRTRRTYMGTLKKISGTDLIEIKVPLTTRADRNSISWQPGQYAYISIAGSRLLGLLRSNPFTIASVAIADEEMRFIARVRAGNTARMTQFHSFEGSLRLSVEGPYGNVNHQKALFNCDRVLFVAGGIGATFISPLYRQLLLQSQGHGQGGPAVNFEFAWIARSIADTSWAFPEDAEEMKHFVSRLQVYLTRTESARSSATKDNATLEGEKNVFTAQSESGEIANSDEEKKLLSSGGFREQNISNGLSVITGRPDLARLVEQLFSYSETERVAVVVCGPPQLTRSLRREVGHWIAKGRDCFWWDETFGL